MGLFDAFLQKKSKPRILVADDDPSVRTLVGDLLSLEGYEVVEVHDGLEALAALKKGRYDLLITDINMPRMQGPELIKVLRTSSEHKGQPIIVLSSEGDIPTLNEVFELGALAFLPKPFQAHQLLAKVSAFFTQSKPPSAPS